MRADIPSGVGGTGSGTVAVTTVEVLESPPKGGLQATVQALSQFVNHSTGKDVHTNVKDALRGVRTTGNNS